MTRAGRYQQFHITIIMTVNIPIIDIIVISAVNIVFHYCYKIWMLLSKKPYNIHGIDDNIVLLILRY